MTFFQELTSNQTLMTGVTGWVVAQVLKTILDIGLNHSFNPERLVGSGGMPSSHSSTVCSLATAAALWQMTFPSGKSAPPRSSPTSCC